MSQTRFIDSRTMRPAGDHGTGNDAIAFALERQEQGEDVFDILAFLRCWTEGTAHEEWPDYYDWLKENGR